MVDASPRVGLQCSTDGTRQDPPDFSALLRLADSQSTAKDAAPSVSRALACFRDVAHSHGLSPLLIELAILNDELLNLALEPHEERIERATPDHLSPADNRLQFVSIVASYRQFGQSDGLLRAWERATAEVVKLDQRAIVGETDTYQHALIWHQITPEEVLKAAPEPSNWNSSLQLTRLADDQSHSDTITVGFPTRYSLGADTIKRIQGNGVPTDHQRSLDESKEVTRRLISRLLSAAKRELSDSAWIGLNHSVLVIVPFSRPWLFGGAVQDRPGGGVFMLCDSRAQSAEELATRLSRVQNDINWYLFRAAVLEAQHLRYSTRETDLTQFNHLVTRHLRSAASQTYIARDLAEKLGIKNPELLKALNSAEQTTQRLEKIGDIARKAVLVRSGRQDALRSLSQSKPMPIAKFVDLFRNTAEDLIADARRIGLEEWRLQRSRDARPSFEFVLGAVSQIQTDAEYLQLLLYEVYRNALAHGGFEPGRNDIHTVVSIQGKFLVASICNPLDPAARASLSELLRRGGLLLGLTQMELLARAYSVPLPRFSMKPDDMVEVKCVVGLIQNGSGPDKP